MENWPIYLKNLTLDHIRFYICKCDMCDIWDFCICTCDISISDFIFAHVTFQYQILYLHMWHFNIGFLYLHVWHVNEGFLYLHMWQYQILYLHIWHFNIGFLYLHMWHGNIGFLYLHMCQYQILYLTSRKRINLCSSFSGGATSWW